MRWLWEKCCSVIRQLATSRIISESAEESCKIFKNAARQLKIHPLFRSCCSLSPFECFESLPSFGINFTGQSKSDLRGEFGGAIIITNAERISSCTDSSSFTSIINICDTRGNCAYRFANVFSFTMLSWGACMRVKINDVINFIRLDYRFIYCNLVSGYLYVETNYPIIHFVLIIDVERALLTWKSVH